METLNEKLKRLAKECENELREIGLENKLKSDIIYSINYRAKRRLGQCCSKRYINISSWLLEIGSDDDIKNTIIHEILHTFDDTIGHKERWQYYARYVSNRTNYHITRTANANEIYVKANIERTFKYKITCKKCGKVFYQQRMTQRTMKNYEEGNMFHRSCGGKEFIIEVF